MIPCCVVAPVTARLGFLPWPRRRLTRYSLLGVMGIHCAAPALVFPQYRVPGRIIKCGFFPANTALVGTLMVMSNDE